MRTGTRIRQISTTFLARPKSAAHSVTQTSPKLPEHRVFTGGADDGIRTRDLLITNQLLYQLSYVGAFGLGK